MTAKDAFAENAVQKSALINAETTEENGRRSASRSAVMATREQGGSDAARVADHQSGSNCCSCKNWITSFSSIC